MSQPQPKCPTCRVVMDPGFVLDIGHGGTRNQAMWVEGQPERSFWTGVKVKGRKQIKIQAYRCPQCGFLAHYAAHP